MKMRYIIFTAVLMCLLGVEGKAQSGILISDKTTNQTPSRIECVYGESLSENYEIHVPYNNGYYVEGTLYFADNANYPHTDRAVAKMVIGANTPYNENGLQLDFIVMQKINHDDKKKYRFWFVSPSNVEISRRPADELSINILPRPIKINASQYYNDYSKKTYDGGTTVKEGFIINFKPDTYYSTDDTKNKTGILDTDVDYVTIGIESAAYKEKDVKGVKSSEIDVIFTGSLSGDKAGNYELVFDDSNTEKKLTFPGTITQKNLTLNLTFDSKPYDGTTAATFTSKTFSHTDNQDIVSGDEITVTSVGTANFESADASETEQTVNIADKSSVTYDNHNYNITFTGSGKINKQALSLNLADNFTYENSQIGSDIVFNKPENTNNEEVEGSFKLYDKNNNNSEVTYSDGYNLPAGDYEVVFTPNSTNYAEVKKTFKVNPKILTLNIEFEKTYDGNKSASTSYKSGYSFSGKNFQNENVDIQSITAEFENKDVSDNEQNVTVSNIVLDNQNYAVANFTGKGKIKKKKLEIKFSYEPKTYDGTTTVNGFSYTLDGFVDASETNVIKLENEITANYEDANASDANKIINLNITDLNLTGNGAGNYEVIMPNPLNGTINRRSTSINLSYTKDKIYDATTTVLDFNGVINNLIDADKNLINVSAEYKDKNVGDRLIYFTISALELFKQNYAYESAQIYNSNNEEIGHLDADCKFQFNNSADCIGKISKCPITLTYSYTNPKPYDGTTDVKDFQVTQITAQTNDGDKSFTELTCVVFENEEISITPKAEYNGKDVRTAKQITISGDVNNDNYEVVTQNPEASIKPSEVVVSQNDKKLEKKYDGSKSVTSSISEFAEYYTVSGIINKNGQDEVQFNPGIFEYESENAGIWKIIFTNPHLDGNSDNYTLTVNEFTGEIKKIKPTIRWFVYDRLIEGKSTEMGYGNKMGSSEDNNKEEEYYLKAAIDEVPYKDKYLPAVYSYRDKGEENYTQINLPTILHPGELVGKVQFVSKDDNYATVSSEIDVAVLLNTTIEHKVTTTVYGFAEIGKKCIYFYSSYYGFFKFTYYLDGQEVPEGYKPKVGKHTLYCKVEDKNGYLPEKQTETIEFTIVPRELNVSEFTWTKDKDGSELRRHYDGTNNVYENQIIEYPQLDKYMIVDGDDVELNIEMSYSSEEVGDRDVNIKYSLKGDDSYCYVFAENVAPEYAKPGEITRCPAVVGFKELDKVYGNSELGKDITATYTYVKFKGEQISVPGHYTYEIRINDNERAEHYPGEMLDVGVYNIRVLFTPEDNEHYETGFSRAEYVKVTPKAISATGVTIADKYYDGTKKVDPNKVKLFEPELDGIIEKDKNNVKLEITNLDKIVYPDFKIGDYQGIVVKVNLAGSGIGNYELKNHELKAASSILPFEFFYNMEPDETGVYQLVYGTSVMGEDFKLINELTETQTVRYVIMDIDKTNQMLVPNTYQVDVQLYDAGTLVLSKTVTVNVVKLKLLTTAPEIAHRKLYDGSVSVRQTGEKCVLTNVVGSDKVRIDEQIQQYDDPNIGSNKTITVTFSLTGPWQSKYIEPDGYVYTDGVITNKDIKVSFLGVGADVCPSSSVPFEFCIDEGLPEKGSITFSDDALNAGFENITLSNSQTAMGINSIEVNIPEKVKAGKYQATLHLESGDGNKLDTLFDFTVNYAASYIISKFTDVVAINNAGYDFVGYQWYKDGHVVENENKQFFNDLPCLYGWYSAKVLTVDGTYANICPRYFDKRTAVSKRANAAGVNVYPNPALPMQAVTVELKDFEDYENCTILIYNLSGVLITKIQNPDRLNTLNLPQGSYTGVVVKDDSRLNFKLIVRK